MIPGRDVIENMPPAVEVKEGYSTKEVQIIYQSDGKEIVRSADVLAYLLGGANRTPTPRAQDPTGERHEAVLLAGGAFLISKVSSAENTGELHRALRRPRIGIGGSEQSRWTENVSATTGPVQAPTTSAS